MFTEIVDKNELGGLRYIRTIGSTKKELDEVNKMGLYSHGSGLYNSNGWHGILIVFSTPSYTFKVDLNMANTGWSIKVWDAYSQKWV